MRPQRTDTASGRAGIDGNDAEGAELDRRTG